jgi:hypothetical protein
MKMTDTVNHFSPQSKTQRAAILRLLIDAHGQWVPLPEILALGCAQYGARILELRRLGFRIENRVEHRDGARHSWFRLVQSPKSPPPEPLKRDSQNPADDWSSRPRATGLPLFDLTVPR